MMKILMVTEDFIPMTGGIAVFLSELSKGFAKKGNDVRVVASKMDAEGGADLNKGYRVTRYRLPRILSSLGIGWQVFRQVFQDRPDILFMGHVMATRGFWIVLMSWLFRIPYVVLVHAGHLPVSKVGIVNRFFTYLFMRNADLLLANSMFTYQLLIERGFPGEKTKILTPGVDTDFFFPANDNIEIARVRMKYTPTREPLIFNVGRLVPKKNQRRIIKAVADLLKRGVRVKCVIAGDGPERENLQKWIEELEMSSQVELIGNTEKEKIRSLYQAADIVVLPSIIENGNYESFGIAALEASACGRAVIVGARGGQTDAVIPEKTGVVVNAEDEEDIACTINRLVDKKDIAHCMGQAGRDYVVANFTWERIADKAASFFSEIAHKNK